MADLPTFGIRFKSGPPSYLQHALFFYFADRAAHLFLQQVFEVNSAAAG
jgi:hypothetical protein